MELMTCHAAFVSIGGFGALVEGTGLGRLRIEWKKITA